MLWRLKSFLQPFWRFLLWGDSTWGKVVKMAGLVLFVGGPWLASRWEIPGYLILHAFEREIISTPFRFGVLLAILVALFWIFVSAGRAYELAGVPVLKVGNELISDHMNFRLQLESKEKDFDTVATLIEVRNQNGDHLLRGRFPLDLEWTHHPQASSIHLRAGIPETVSIALVRQQTLGNCTLQITGAWHLAELDLEVNDTVYLHVRIKHFRNKPITRWFPITKIGPVSFETGEGLPSFKPQAIPAESTRC